MGLFNSNDELTKKFEEIELAFQKEVERSAALHEECETLKREVLNLKQKIQTQDAATTIGDEPTESIANSEETQEMPASGPTEDAIEVSNTAPDVCENIVADSKQDIMVPRLDMISNSIQCMSDKLTQVLKQDSIVKDLHNELLSHKSGLKKEFTTPLLKSMLKYYDRLVMHLNYCKSELEKLTEDSDTKEVMKNMIDEYANIALLVIDEIYQYDIEPIEVNVGDMYEPKKHKAIKILDTNDKEKHNTIASIIKVGFSDDTTGRIFRHTEVEVYKLKTN